MPADASLTASRSGRPRACADGSHTGRHAGNRPGRIDARGFLQPRGQRIHA
jgi:hypothetical protein